MNKQLTDIVAAIDELPDTDNVHCYDYEIRTDDLKALAAEFAKYRAALRALVDDVERSGQASNLLLEGWYDDSLTTACELLKQ